MRNAFILAFGTLFLLNSCVSSKVHNALKSQHNEALAELTDLRRAKGELDNAYSDAQRKLEEAEKSRQTLMSDTMSSGEKIRKLSRNYADLNKSYEFLLENNNALLSQSARENRAMLERLQDLDMKLRDKQDSLETERQTLVELTQKLEQRSARVNELESIIGKQDSTVRHIRNTLGHALKAYEGKGLSVETRDGKVYVSLENSLLFASGSWTVNDKAKAALGALAQVLAENPSMQINVEGHTDNDAFKGKPAVQDNWDLSVMRATAVVKAIVGNSGVNPTRIVASGRSEYLPLLPNDSPENKAINRRTEVIVSPDYSELFKLMEQLEE